LTMIDQEKLEAIFSRYEDDPWDLIPILHDIQEECGYLPKDALKEVARRLEVPFTRVFSVATFYKGFTLAPIPRKERRLGDARTQFYSLTRFYPGFGRSLMGRHQVKVCQGTACHLKGGSRLAEALQRRLGVEPGSATTDLQFSLEQVKCLGNCDKAPMLAVDQDFYNRVGVDRLTKILKPYRKAKKE
jgi:NADH-quinone oxidoreductase subunit E